jgi:hypothetical protein
MLALQQRGELDQRDVHLRLDRVEDHRAEPLDPRRVPVAAARLVPHTQPAHRGRYRDPEALRRSMARQTALHRRDHPNPQILRQGLCHHRWPPPSRQDESDQARVGEALSAIQIERNVL